MSERGGGDSGLCPKGAAKASPSRYCSALWSIHIDRILWRGCDKCYGKGVCLDDHEKKKLKFSLVANVSDVSFFFNKSLFFSLKVGLLGRTRVVLSQLKRNNKKEVDKSHMFRFFFE